MVQVISYQRCRSPAGTVWVSCDVRRDLDWALSCAGTAHSFEFHCGNFHVAQLLLRTRHGKRRRFPCTAADFHSCVGSSYALQRGKVLGPGCLAIQKTGSCQNPIFKLTPQREAMTKLIGLLLHAFAFGCFPPTSHRSCVELETDPSVSLGEFYSHCRAHSNVN